MLTLLDASFLASPGIINMDLAWNMATEDQALDRVHRIGQSTPSMSSLSLSPFRPS